VGALVLLVLLAAVGALARLTLFMDIEKLREDLPMPAELYDQMAQRTHRGDGPCLRYIPPNAVPAEEWTRTVADARASGVAESLPSLSPLFLRWAEETDAPHHATDQAAEMLAQAREHMHGIDRLVLALNYSRVLRSLRAREQAAKSRSVGEAERKASPDVRARLHALWERHRLALSGPRIPSDLRYIHRPQ